jgi:hypothetical protein
LAYQFVQAIAPTATNKRFLAQTNCILMAFFKVCSLLATVDKSGTIRKI